MSHNTDDEILRINIFQEKEVRTSWNAEEEDWYFSVIDICWILSGCESRDTARKYWNKLKQRLKNEGSELVTFCHQLKLPAKDGKKYATDVLNTKGVLRLIQSIPSKTAEPFKLWLASVGSERIDEIADPEKAILRGADFYRAKGYFIPEQYHNSKSEVTVKSFSPKRTPNISNIFMNHMQVHNLWT